MSDYILTTLETSITSMNVVKSVKDITKLRSSSNLIIESYTDSDYDFITFLVDSFRKFSMKNIVIVSEKPSKLVSELARGMGIPCIPTPEYIRDYQSLSELLTYLEGMRLSGTVYEDDSRVLDALHVVNERIESSLVDEPRAVKRSVIGSLGVISDTISDSYLSHNLSAELVNFVNMGNSKMRDKDLDIQSLESSLHDLTDSSSKYEEDIGLFSPYTYSGTSKVLVVKELTPVRYLTTFLSSYLVYLTKVHSMTSRLIVVDRKSPFVDSRYGSGDMFTHVDSEVVDQRLSSLFLLERLYTCTPTRSVMDALMSRGVELYVILDRTPSRSSIVTGRGITTVNAVSSKRVMRDLGLKSSTTIVNDAGEGSNLGILAQVPNLPKSKDDFNNAIISAFTKDMERLSALVGLSI